MSECPYCGEHFENMDMHAMECNFVGWIETEISPLLIAYKKEIEARGVDDEDIGLGHLAENIIEEAQDVAEKVREEYPKFATNSEGDNDTR